MEKGTVNGDFGTRLLQYCYKKTFALFCNIQCLSNIC